MSVKILIERQTSDQHDPELSKLLKELRARAVMQPGHISGETLFSVGRPHSHLVISTWRSVRDWEAWQNSAKRRELAEKIRPLLAAPEKVSIYGVTPPGMEEGA